MSQLDPSNPRTKLRNMTDEQIVAFTLLVVRYGEIGSYETNFQRLIIAPFDLPDGFVSGSLEHGLAFGIAPDGSVST